MKNDNKIRDALATYSNEPSDLYDNAVDLLTDLMHLCKAQGYTFDAVLTTATMHFEDEDEDEVETRYERQRQTDMEGQNLG